MISRTIPCLRLGFAALLITFAIGAPACADPTDDVRPMVGTAGTGHTYPGAVYPFGLVVLSPDTGTDGWEHCSGYHYEDNTIIGFSHTHISGTGCLDLGDILFQPTTGDVRLDAGDPAKPDSGYRSAYSHDDESASPGYYRVLLKDYGINVELTATAHAGLHKYTFPASDKAHIVIDLTHGIGNHTTDSALIHEDDQTISGYRRSEGWAHDKTFYFVAKFSRPFDSHEFVADGTSMPGAVVAKGRGVKGHVDFQTKAGDVILVRVGISATSLEEARKNLDAEIPKFDFDGTVAATRAAWNRELGTVEITAADPDVRRTFYTALYHSMLNPNLFNDADKTYFGADGHVHAADFNYYSTFSVWDQFRAWHPLMTIIQPKRVNDFIKSMLVFYQQRGAHQLPIWELCSNETNCMIGYNTMPIIADAYAKGFRDYDVNAVYAAMLDSVQHEGSFVDDFNNLGYIPTQEPDHNQGDKQSVSRSLEYAYDDWCIAQMARALGKDDDAQLYLKRAANYRNLYDPATKFMRGKTKAGNFVDPFDPKKLYWADYTEADAWQYNFAVQHDPKGLIDLMGGDHPFIDHLDNMFSEDSMIHDGSHDITGLIGQYAHGNEPVHHVAYLYNYAGAPSKTAERVRQIMTTLYTDKPDGSCGNDDCGQMSAWYALSAMGFYPVNPADGNYVLGSPLVDKAVIHLDPAIYPSANSGSTFTITAKDNSKDNIYIQSATLNGQPLTRSYFTHAELVKGGDLLLQMGPKPNQTWGQDKSSRPPSMTPQ
jgi:predicted alpha-1,2-mannosidase